MLRVTSLLTRVGIRDQTKMESLVSHLRSKGYSAAIRSMFTGMFTSSGMDEPDEQLVIKLITQGPGYRFLRRPRLSDVLGDIFITDDVVLVLTPAKDSLQASAIGYQKQKEHLQNFCADVEDGIQMKFGSRKVKRMNFDWKALSSRVSEYQRGGYLLFGDFSDQEPVREVTEHNVRQPSYDSEDIKVANLLVDGNVRKFVFRLAQVGKMIAKDAVDLAKKPRIFKRLFSLDLMGKEYLLTCKKDQHTICVVPSKEELTKKSMISFRCSCGRALPEENLQLIYTLTKRGKKLIDGSLWMSIWITELLKQNEIEEGGIKWRFETGGEEIDIVVEDFGSRLFLELKDREFGLGDAYPFMYRLTRYGGRYGIVVTMDKVALDAKSFFEEETRRREHPIRIQYLEGSQNIPNGLTRILQEVALSQVRRVIRPFSERTGFDLWPVVEYWINTRTKK